MVEDTVGEARRADEPLLGIPDREVAKVTQWSRPGPQATPDLDQAARHRVEKGARVGTVALSFQGAMQRQLQIRPIAEAVEEAGLAPHAVGAGVPAEVWSSSSTAAPYLSTRPTPTPGTCFKDASVAQRCVAISASCALVKTL